MEHLQEEKLVTWRSICLSDVSLLTYPNWSIVIGLFWFAGVFRHLLLIDSCVITGPTRLTYLSPGLAVRLQRAVTTVTCTRGACLSKVSRPSPPVTTGAGASERRAAAFRMWNAFYLFQNTKQVKRTHTHTHTRTRTHTHTNTNS
jgi:hypothetical protein